MKGLPAILFAALLASIAAAIGIVLRGAPPLPRHAHVPAFRLVERSGRAVSLEDLRGKVWIADFIFTRCRGPCPLMTARLAELAAALAGEADLRIVSISADPDFDRPELLARYAEEHGATDPRWLFLTAEEGRRDAVARLSRGMLLAAEPRAGETAGETAGEILHSDRLVLVDRGGAIRGYYDPLDEESRARLLGDARRLLREAAP